MNYKIGEIVAKSLVVSVLAITTIAIFYFAPWERHKGERIIFLTAVAKNGVWTEEKVNGSNHWLNDFKQAVIILKYGENVLFRFTSMDVTHSFYVPELNIGPVDVWPGVVYEKSFKANKIGSFKYYCTKVCGKNHFYMQGKIIILDPKIHYTDAQIRKMQNDSIIKGKPMQGESMAMSSSMIEHGKDLFMRKNCNTCHGDNGIGGVVNVNYALKTIPALNTLANKLKIPDKESADILIKLLEKNLDIDKLDDNPPFPTYSRFQAQYATITKKILEGAALVQKTDSLGPVPPLSMPAWDNYLTKKEINSILAYLISLNNWEE